MYAYKYKRTHVRYSLLTSTSVQNHVQFVLINPGKHFLHVKPAQYAWLLPCITNIFSAWGMTKSLMGHKFPNNLGKITFGQRSKLIFSISRLLASFIFKMVANGKFRSPKIVVSLTQDTSCYLHEGATAERCVRK